MLHLTLVYSFLSPNMMFSSLLVISLSKLYRLNSSKLKLMCVSSAYITNFSLSLTVVKSFIIFNTCFYFLNMYCTILFYLYGLLSVINYYYFHYILKSNGSNIDPWGTPVVILVASEFWLLNTTNCPNYPCA